MLRASLLLGLTLGLLSPALSSGVALAQLKQGREPGPWADTQRDEDLRIKLVTFGQGDAIHQYWGHNALIVEDTRRGVSAMYNFGMFGFGADMLPKYLKGQLEFWVAAMPVSRTFRNYAAANRSIRVRELNLDPDKRRQLAERLAFFARPDNRNYRYHHYDNNCSTKLRDLIDEAIDGQLRRQFSTPARLTYRGHTRRYTQHDPLIHFLLVLWMNDSMEAAIPRYNEAFLPDELERLVDEARYRNEAGDEVRLVERAYTVFDANRKAVPATPSTAWPGLLGLGLVLGVAAWMLGRQRGRGLGLRVLFGLYQAAIGLVLGVPGLVLGFFLLTGWKVTHWNENLYLTNPLTFAALPLGIAMAFGSKRAERAAAWCWLMLAAGSLLLLVLKLLPNFDQQTLLPMVLYLPINLGFALVFYETRLKQRLQALRR